MKKVIVFVLLVLTAACNYPPRPAAPPIATPKQVDLPALTPAPSPTPVPPRVLTICMGREPASLFLYGDGSESARSVHQAIYDGPYDVVGYDWIPVLLEQKPTLANGGARLVVVAVKPGSLVLDAGGSLVNLGEGVKYLPAGCHEPGCAATYTGSAPVEMDQLVVTYHLRPGISWSDGISLTAQDSFYSYQVAQKLYPRARVDLLAHTLSYRALDETTLEWTGIPGYLNPQYPTAFFAPLPGHAWQGLSAQELLTATLPARQPLGWGPYQIDEWTPGDHITLSRNPNYFRAGDKRPGNGLPKFETLVFRFMADGEEALTALLAGECDFIDETARLEQQAARLQELEKQGTIKVAIAPGAAWEHLDFGIGSLNSQALPIFKSKETRQAVAQCIDRQKIASLLPGSPPILDAYLLPGHPLANPDARRYAYDPAAAASLLETAGWIDGDNNPATPRLSQGVNGLPDGTPLQFTFLATEDSDGQLAAGMIKESLAQCGMAVTVGALPAEQLFASGPEGPLFGRQFSLAQFAWVSSLEPPCYLFTSAEIPGPYPQFPKGWGGANASGFSSPEYDQACQLAMNSLPDDPVHAAAHRQAQAIFADQLPAIPLYSRPKVVAMRPDMCPVTLDPSSESALWNLESLDYGEQCQ